MRDFKISLTFQGNSSSFAAFVFQHTICLFNTDIEYLISTQLLLLRVRVLPIILLQHLFFRWFELPLGQVA
jgi:hypothetical protein